MGAAMETASGYRVDRIRKDFPILEAKVHGKKLVYLDNAATTQKPREVIGAIREYYEEQNSNIHRGVHHLSEVATKAYEGTRKKIASFLNAADAAEIVFLRGATEAINLVASTYGRANVGAGDEVLITEMEHHSNIVPWQMLCDEKGAKLRVAPMNDRGELLVEEFKKLLCTRTKIVALSHMSNALGTINPVKELVAMAHEKGVPVLVDGAQAVPHLGADVQDLDCDFYVFSGHKMYGPTGVGALYGKKALLEAMPPWQGGGEMILSVHFEKTVYNHVPHKFEAGTPNIGGVCALSAAVDYLEKLGLSKIAAHEADLLEYGTEVLSRIEGLEIRGTARNRACVISFTLEGIHPHDIGTILDGEGVAVRTGHHCAQPVMDHFGIPATVRASFGLYNTREEVDALAAGLGRVVEIFRR